MSKIVGFWKGTPPTNLDDLLSLYSFLEEKKTEMIGQTIHRDDKTMRRLAKYNA